MGRWGSGIYDSDTALDYQSTITNMLHREVVFWCSTEQAQPTGHWLSNVLSPVELMLLFEQSNIDTDAYINSEKAVQRWQQTFLQIWDGDWRDQYESYPYSNPAYRVQHRAAVVKLFERLEGIVKVWENWLPDKTEIPSLLEGYPLPYFSIHRYINKANEEAISPSRLVGDCLDHLLRDIIYLLSPETRAIRGASDEQIAVAVDILGLLCEKYQQSPGVNAQIVSRWRESTTQIWKQIYADEKIDWPETDPLYQNVIRAFDRLEAVAHKYPAYEW